MHVQYHKVAVLMFYISTAILSSSRPCRWCAESAITSFHWTAAGNDHLMVSTVELSTSVAGPYRLLRHVSGTVCETTLLLLFITIKVTVASLLREHFLQRYIVSDADNQ